MRYAGGIMRYQGEDWKVNSEQPLTIVGGEYSRDDGDYNDDRRNQKIDINRRSIEKLIGYAQESVDNCNSHPEYNCANNGYLDRYQKKVSWLRCLDVNLLKSAGKPEKSNSEISQIPNCPTALPNSCISWSEKNSDFHWWDIKNRCNKAVVVTYEDSSDGNGRVQTNLIPPGSSERVTVRSRPQFGVWDAKDSQALTRNIASYKVPADTYWKCKQGLSLGE